MLQRILVAVVGIPALLFIFCWCPVWATALLLDALCLIGAHELCSAVMVKTKANRYFSMAGLIGFFIILMPYWNDKDSALVILPWLIAFATLFVFICMVVEYGKPNALKFQDMCALFTAGAAIPLALGCLLRLRLLPYGGGLVLIPLVAAFCSDAMALFGGSLFGGKLFGDKKLAPRVSPKKTREGAVAGLLGGMAGMILFRIAFFLVTEVQLHIGWCLLLGLVGAAVGQLGDLVFSCIKREFGIKDYGNLLPGHGGVLDRFDSVIFAAPVLWLIISQAAIY